VAEFPENEQNVSQWKVRYVEYLKNTLNIPVSFSFLRPSFKSSELMALTAKFAAMMEAGLPVIGSLRVLAHEADNLRLKQQLENVAIQVEKGFSLTQSFSIQGSSFPPILVSMINAGENSGRLDIALQRLTHHFEKQDELEQKVRSATAYPKFIAVVLFLVVFFLFMFVIPTFQGVFQSLGAELPLITRIILSGGNALNNYGLLIIGSLFFLFILFSRLIKTEKGLQVKDRVSLLIPIYKTFVRKLLVARFCRTLSTMLGSGIDIILSLELAGKVTGSIVFEDRIQEARLNIIQGLTVTEALKRTGFFPPMALGLVNTGEQTGTLDKMFERSAAFYEQELDYFLARLGSILEPAFVLFMALIVGSVVMAIFLPMLQLFTLY